MSKAQGAAVIVAQILAESPDLPVSDLVDEAIRRHTAQRCAFADGAAPWVIATYRQEGEPGIPRLCELLDEVEIFCPHEGIDRRHESASASLPATAASARIQLPAEALLLAL